MKMNDADQSGASVDPQPGEDPEEQGLRILARFIARKLAKSRRDENAWGHEQSEGDAAPPVSMDEDIS